ncbi:MFS transporter [Alicyclobacillus tolerans]|uniref:MFS transporter n=1 Tax=Alicyclobacillus tolerans TaxID=90970 RepID=UPI001F0314C5|nr:MFS transporter [Alicyclobacillus tolerans]MCF8566089.1 MFS transporter [Alicyclobacillus tolerans]
MQSLTKTMSYTSGSVAANLVSLAFTTYAQFYYVDRLKGSAVWIGAAAVVQAVYATLMYPMLGYLSDRTHSRWGRRVPFILYGAFPLGFSFALVWIPPFSSAHPLWLAVWFLGSAIFYDTMFNVTMVNWSALFPEIFHSPKERASASAWKQMFGIVGLVAGLALPQMIASKIGWPLMGAIFGGITVVTLLTTIPSLNLRARRRRELERKSLQGSAEPVDPIVPKGLHLAPTLKNTLLNRSFLTFLGMRFFVQFAFAMLTADLSFYAEYNLHITGTQQSLLLLSTLAMALPLVYVWGFVIPRAGAFATTAIAIGLFAAALIPFSLAHTFSSALFSCTLLGIGLSAILVLTDVLISDVIDEDELKTKVRREGMYYGIHGLVISLVTPAQAATTTVVLILTGYTHADTQPRFALFGFRLMVTIIPFAALVLGFIVFTMYPLRRKQVRNNQMALSERTANAAVTVRAAGLNSDTKYRYP